MNPKAKKKTPAPILPFPSPERSAGNADPRWNHVRELLRAIQPLDNLWHRRVRIRAEQAFAALVPQLLDANDPLEMLLWAVQVKHWSYFSHRTEEDRRRVADAHLEDMVIALERELQDRRRGIHPYFCTIANADA